MARFLQFNFLQLRGNGVVVLKIQATLEKTYTNSSVCKIEDTQQVSRETPRKNESIVQVDDIKVFKTK